MYIAGFIYGLAEMKFGNQTQGNFEKSFAPALYSNAMHNPKKLSVIIRHVWRNVVKDTQFTDLLKNFVETCEKPRNQWGDFGLGYYAGRRRFFEILAEGKTKKKEVQNG